MASLERPPATGAASPDPLPALDASYDLDQATVDAFARDGHGVVRGLASREELNAYAPIIEQVALASRRDHRPLEDRDTYGKAFLQLQQLWVCDDAVKRFVFARRFAKVAAALLQVEGVRLYHDQALFKEPGGGYTPWHQDQTYWPLDTDRTITMWMPLVDVPAEVGSMTFASGSHRFGHFGEYGISDKEQVSLDALIDERGFARKTHGAMSLGDATFHTGWTLHSAPANPTSLNRSVMTVIYYADGAKVGPADHPIQKFDLKVWLPGRRPGDLAASEINPVLYPR